MKPGEQQVVTIHADANRQIDVSVSFPNGQKISNSVRPDASDTASFTFTQPANAISRHNRTAKVDAELRGPAGGQAQALTTHYRVGYGKIDISSTAVPANQKGILTVWIHAHARSTVKGKIQVPGAAARKFTVKTGKKGWATYKYHLGRVLTAGQKVTIHGSVRLKGHTYKTTLHALVS